MTEIRITLPHLENVTPPSDDTKLELNINDAGSILHADGEIFPLSDSRITLRYILIEKSFVSRTMVIWLYNDALGYARLLVQNEVS